MYLWRALRRKKKLNLGSKDDSYQVYESLLTILQNIFLAIAVGIIAWGLTTALKLTIEKYTARH